MAVQLLDSASNRQTRDYYQTHVTTGFRRTYGTNAGLSNSYPECDSWSRVERGSARGQAVASPGS